MDNESNAISGTALREEWLRQYGRTKLKVARGDQLEVRIALCRFLKQGYSAGFSTGEMVDWIGVSTPSILEDAGFGDEEAASAMDLLGSITDEEIASIQL